MPEQQPQDRLADVEKLMKIFRPERMVHIAITIISILVLVGCAIYLISQDEVTWALGLFGSTGAITYSTSRLLKMWNDVIKVLYGKEVGNS